MKTKAITALNRAAWNEISYRHQQQRSEFLRRLFTDDKACCLDAFERDRLARLGIEGRRVVQPCCNNGRELISLKNLGRAKKHERRIAGAVWYHAAFRP